jgi:flagellar assembly protein FliH
MEKHSLPTVDEVFRDGLQKAAAKEEPLTLDSITSSSSESDGRLSISDLKPGGIERQERRQTGLDPTLVESVKQQAAALEQRARQTLENAKQEAKVIRKEAREKGYAEGMAEAEKMAKEELVPLLTNIRDTQKRLSKLKNVILKQNEVEIIDLSLEIARKVIGSEMALNPAMVAGVIKTALDKVDLSERITVKINPVEYEHLMKSVPEYLKDVWIVADSNVSKGGALIETDSGTFDARIEAQMDEIESSLKKDIVEE